MRLELVWSDARWNGGGGRHADAFGDRGAFRRASRSLLDWRWRWVVGVRVGELEELSSMTGLGDRHHAPEAVPRAVREPISVNPGKPLDRPEVLIVRADRDRLVEEYVVTSDPTEQDRARGGLRRYDEVSLGHGAGEPSEQVDGRADLALAVFRERGPDALHELVARQVTDITGEAPADDGRRSRGERRRVPSAASGPNHPNGRTVGLVRRDLLVRCAAVAKGDVLRIPLECGHVDARGVLGEEFPPARCDPCVTPPSAL